MLIIFIKAHTIYNVMGSPTKSLGSEKLGLSNEIWRVLCVSLVVSNKNIEVSDDNLGIFYENLMVSNESLWVIDPITNLGSSVKCSGFTKKYVVSYKKLRISAEKLGVSQ